MKQGRLVLVLSILALGAGLGSRASATVARQWESFYDSPFHNADSSIGVVVDHDDNIIVVGSIESIPGAWYAYDIATVKYNPVGETLWTRHGVVSPDLPALARGIACDEQNNIYVVGSSGQFAAEPLTSWAMTAVKFRSNGDTAWVRRFPDVWFSFGQALAVDADQDVYLAGSSARFFYLDSENFRVVKCDSNGDTLWTRYVDGPAHLTDSLAAMCLDPSGNVIVTGSTNDPDATSHRDWLTAKLTPDGDTQWVRHFDGGDHQDDYPVAVTTDGTGNVYVCGASYHNTTYWDYQVVKYGPSGDIQFMTSYNNDVTDGTDIPCAIAVDQYQNIYVTGTINDTIDGAPSESASFATVKFGPAGGLPVWVQKYRGAQSVYASYATALKLDQYGNVYVTGSSDNDVLGDLQQATLKYDPRGHLEWEVRNGGMDMDAHARAVALDSRGSVYVAGDDYVDAEDYDYALVRYSGPDVGVARVIEPRDTIRVNRSVTPTIMVENYSPVPATDIPVYMLIGATLFSTTLSSLDPYESTLVRFDDWASSSAGDFPIRAYTTLSEDWENGNDTAHGFVSTVLPWVVRDTLPSGPKKKYVKDGGALAYDDNLNLIYAVKGNNTTSFYSFGPTQTWVERDSVPTSSSRRKVKKGAAMTYGGDNTVYLAKGNRTAEFWAYHPALGWVAKSDLPYVLKGGTAMAYVPNLGCIYILPAENTRQFWYYDTGGTWHTGLPDVPNGPKNKTCKDGTALAYDGVQYLYALKGKTSEFYAYNVMNNTWLTLNVLPNSSQTHKKKTSGDGAALAFASGMLYAFKGNNTNEFWCWNPATDTWTEVDSLLSGAKKKKVKGGGSLVAVNGKVYALRGNGTNDFYLYNANIGSFSFAVPGQPGSQGQAGRISLRPTLRVAPNPFRSSSVVIYSLPKPGALYVKLYDVTGRMEIDLFAGRQRAGSYRLSLADPRLAAGVYFLKMRFDDGAGEQQLTTKVLIER